MSIEKLEIEKIENNLPKVNETEVDVKDISTISQLEMLAEKLVEGSLATFKNKNDAFKVLMKAVELQIPLTIALDYMYPIKDKIAMSYHLMAGLARKAGVEIVLIKDFEPLFNEKGEAYDYVTEVNIIRINPTLNREFESKFKFTWTQAVRAGYTTGPNKGNWEKQPQNMMLARCVTRALRFAAPDLMLFNVGMIYEVSEMADEQDSGVFYEVGEDGAPKIINLETHSNIRNQ